MKEKIREYYRAVRLSNAFIIVFSTILIVLGVLLYLFYLTPISFGALTVIFSFGIFQLALSCYRFLRSFKEYNLAQSKLEESELNLKTHELPKLDKRIQHINWARKAELMSFVLFFSFCILAVLLKNQEFLFGSSAVLTLQIAVMLCYDLIRQYHIREYIRQLQRLY
jgi:hypothetical protein